MAMARMGRAAGFGDGECRGRIAVYCTFSYILNARHVTSDEMSGSYGWDRMGRME
jgi:hypothetical protein